MYRYKAKLLKIVDGDTIDAEINLGFSILVHKRVRLWKINAPETRTRDLQEKKQGKRTKRRLKELLRANDNHFELISHGFGKFGRCLGEIFIDNRSINDLLIEEDLAKEYYGD
jgi:micrococcal nuclease